MKFSWAEVRMAVETISWSCSDVRFHWAASRVIPRHGTGDASKLTAGGGESVGVFLMTFTAGAAMSGVLGVLGTGSGMPVWIPRLTVLRREELEPPYSECRSRSEVSAGEDGDQVEERGLE